MLEIFVDIFGSQHLGGKIFDDNMWWDYKCLMTPCEGELVEVAQDLIVQARAQLGGV